MLNVKLGDIEFKRQKTLVQCIKHDAGKEYFFGTPYLFKNIHDDIDTDILLECWKYFKSNKTNLKKESVKPETKKRIELAEEDIKAGRIYSLEEVKKELGI